MFSGSGRSSTKSSTNRPRRPSVYLMAGFMISSSYLRASTRSVAQPPEAVEPDDAIDDGEGARPDQAADQLGEEWGDHADETEADRHAEAGAEHGHHDTI